MYKLLSKEAKIEINGQFRTLKAIMNPTMSRQRVEYLDADDQVVFSEPYSQSKYNEEKRAKSIQQRLKTANYTLIESDNPLRCDNAQYYAVKDNKYGGVYVRGINYSFTLDEIGYDLNLVYLSNFSAVFTLKIIDSQYKPLLCQTS